MKENHPPATDVEQLLLRIKREIHDLAIHPSARGIDPYVRLKTVDAVINKSLSELYKKVEAKDGN